MFIKILKKWQKALGLAPMPPMDTLEKYIEFADRQSAFVSQVCLYTYIKTRAGTQWPKLFEDETYLISMKIARWHIFGACVADMGVYLGAMLVKRGAASKDQAQQFSETVISRILSDYDQDDIPSGDFQKMMKVGLARCNNADWDALAEGPTAFQTSADALIKWAPIADELKDLDKEIVRNSIHMRWINIRREIKDNLVADAVVASS